MVKRAVNIRERDHKRNGKSSQSHSNSPAYSPPKLYYPDNHLSNLKNPKMIGFSFILVNAILTATSLASPLEKRIDHNGIATFYEQNGGTGSCGQVHKESDRIIALSPSWQGSGYPPAYCGRKIQITNTGGGQNNNGQGKVIEATVADTCPGCDSNHLGKCLTCVTSSRCKKWGLTRIWLPDLSHGAFQALTGGALDPPGVFNIRWYVGIMAIRRRTLTL